MLKLQKKNRKQQSTKRRAFPGWLAALSGALLACWLAVAGLAVFLPGGAPEGELTPVQAELSELKAKKKVKPTPAPTAKPTPSPTPAPTPTPHAGDPEDWNLILVNPWNQLPEGYTVELATVPGTNHKVDARCLEALEEMLEDCRAEGLQPVIQSSYRTQSTQKYLYDRKVNQYIGYGYSKSEARVKAATIVALPGTSEHQLGLALDIVDRSNRVLNKSQEDTAVQKWLMENSWKYGFILRYPNEKSDITGIIYEPWHYRYVGPEAAAEIHELGLCLEEYLDLLAADGAGASDLPEIAQGVRGEEMA